MDHQSFWKATTQAPTFPSLNRDLEVDTLVIGGGITGITTAYLLQQAGHPVHLIEGDTIGSGDSGHTSGHLSTSTDLQYRAIRDQHGQETANAVARAMRGAVDRIKKISEAAGIDCDFAYQPGYLYTRLDQHLEDLEEEWQAVRDTLLAVSWQEDSPLPFDILKAIRFDNNARFHPLKFIYGLAERLQAADVPIYTQTRALEMSSEDGLRVFKTDRGPTIRARKVVIATHLPAFNKAEQTALPPSRTYVMAYRVEGEVPQGLFWDMQDPYHYTRNAEYEGGQVLITGGADHRTGELQDTGRCFEEVENYIRERYPVREFLYRWSGQWYEPTDKLPLIGQSILHDNVYVAGGYSGDGLVFGVASAHIISDLLMGRDNELAEFFQPRRFNLTGDYLKNNADVVKHFIKDRLPFDLSEVEKIPPGSGEIVQQGLAKYAVYRNEEGELTVLSPVCTHMNCIVQWNQSERTWDCPCHGGQFTPAGDPLRAPVTKPLEQQSLREVTSAKAESK